MKVKKQSVNFNYSWEELKLHIKGKLLGGGALKYFEEVKKEAYIFLLALRLTLQTYI